MLATTVLPRRCYGAATAWPLLGGGDSCRAGQAGQAAADENVRAPEKPQMRPRLSACRLKAGQVPLGRPPGHVEGEVRGDDLWQLSDRGCRLARREGDEFALASEAAKRSHRAG